MREKRQHNTSFNGWYAFELLPQYLEYEGLHIYEQWRDAHWMELRQVKRYSEMLVELVSALKEGTTSSLLAAPMIKTNPTEDVFVVNVEGRFPSESKEKVIASTSISTSNMVFPLSRYGQVTQTTLIFVGLCKILILCKNSNFIWKRNMEVFVEIKCSGS